mmetsp:Transcript_26149/g.55349  ORF Transcript_26149/g.55349 Transcript_26149/m.55349 type:complete len:501 (-) Transcript_26149:73-1575(-)
MLGHIRRRAVQKVLGQFVTSACQCRVHEAPLQAGIEEERGWRPLLCLELAKMVGVHIASFLILLVLRVEADEAGEHRELLRLHVLEEFIRQGDAARLAAEGEHGVRKIVRQGGALGDNLRKKLLHLRGISAEARDEQAVRGIREGNLLLARQGFDAACQLKVLLSDGLGEHGPDDVVSEGHTSEEGQELAKLVVLASEVHELGNNVARCHGGCGYFAALLCPDGLEAAEVAHGLLEIVGLQRCLDHHNRGARREGYLLLLHLGDKPLHLQEVPGHELHAELNLVGALVRLEAQRGDHLKDLLDKLRIHTPAKRIEELVHRADLALGGVFLEEELQLTKDVAGVLLEALHGLHSVNEAGRRHRIKHLQHAPAAERLAMVAVGEGLLEGTLWLLDAGPLRGLRPAPCGLGGRLILILLELFGLALALASRGLGVRVAKEEHVCGHGRAKEKELGAGRPEELRHPLDDGYVVNRRGRVGHVHDRVHLLLCTGIRCVEWAKLPR